MKYENIFQEHFDTAKSLLYDKCGFRIEELFLEEESKEYGACTFKLNGFKIIFRISKITPTKTGQFVTIWKRNTQSITEPFELADDFDFIIISSKDENKFGQFIFPKSILFDKGMISGNDKKGKCGIRVYPPWDKACSKQAEKTQEWQTKYFLKIDNKREINLNLAQQLLGSNPLVDQRI